MIEKEKLLSPKIDLVFHILFRQDKEKIIKGLISSILGKNIQKVKLGEDRYLVPKYPEDKLGIIDFKAILEDGSICTIEIQLLNYQDIEERELFYWSGLFREQLKKGNRYKELNKVISVIIIDYELKKLEEIEDLHTEWKIKEVKTGKDILLTDKLEIHIIELPKVKKAIEKDKNNKLAQWMMFIDNPNEEGVKRIVEKNEEIKEAMEELEIISGDAEARRLAELRQKYILDQNSCIDEAVERGLKKGIEEGIEKGIKNNKIEVAKRMLKQNMNIELICQITDLTKEEIEKIK